MRKTDQQDDAGAALFMKHRGPLRKFYDKFISLKGEPREIASSTALGVFIGVTPTIPFHTLTITFLCLLFRRNLTAAILSATIISNPVTIPLFYFGQYELGKAILGIHHSPFVLNDYSVGSIFELGWHIFYPLQVGGLVHAIAFAIPAYFIAYRAVQSVRNRYETSEGNPEETPPPTP